MISAQVIKNSITEYGEVTRTAFCIYDVDGELLVSAGGKNGPDTKAVCDFAGSAVDSQIIGDCYLFKICEEEDPQYILAAIGDGDHVYRVGRGAVVMLSQLLEANREKLTASVFFRNLLLDNLLLVDIHQQAAKLKIETNAQRIVIVFTMPEGIEDVFGMEILSQLFSEKNGDYLTAVDEEHILLVHEMKAGEDLEEVEGLARTGVDMLETETLHKAAAAFGNPEEDLKNLSLSYKEARMAMEVGKIFYAGKRVISYNCLGIGRLVYQLPENLCRIFLKEIFGQDTPVELDQESLATINEFFENSLNVSETARKLFVHRNTLVYRIEKLSRTSGLDIRKFEDAMTFKIALMVGDYLEYIRKNGR